MRECLSLEEVRGCIDDIDRQVIRLLAERGGYVLQASKFKKSDADVKAPARVEQVIAKVRALADREGIDADLIETLYREMIGRFINLELIAYRREGSSSVVTLKEGI